MLGLAPAGWYSLAMEFVVFTIWALYFLPFAVSAGNEHEHPLPILVFNAVAGWTGVGWVLALIWALHPSPRSMSPNSPNSPVPPHGGALVISLHRTRPQPG